MSGIGESVHRRQALLLLTVGILACVSVLGAIAGRNVVAGRLGDYVGGVLPEDQVRLPPAIDVGQPAAHPVGSSNRAPLQADPAERPSLRPTPEPGTVMVLPPLVYASPGPNPSLDPIRTTESGEDGGRGDGRRGG